MDGKEMFIPIALFGVIGYIAWVIFASIRRFLVARLQAGIQSKLLDRIDSSQALLNYVETEAGREFLNSLTVERGQRAAPYNSILVGVQAAIMLIVFGTALLVLHATHMLPADGFVVMGVIPIALGIGFALAAGATYILSRNFGLLEKAHKL